MRLARIAETHARMFSSLNNCNLYIFLAKKRKRFLRKEHFLLSSQYYSLIESEFKKFKCTIV